MTGADVRDARRLLGWSQHRLAVRAKVSQATVSDYERNGYYPLGMHDGRDRVAAIRAVLEQAGVEFTDGEEPGVKLRKTDL